MYKMLDNTMNRPERKSESQPEGAVTSLIKDNAALNKDRIKRPMNSFMLWATARRKKMLVECPKMHNSEISKRLGIEWQLFGDTEKKPFIDQAKRLRAEHLTEYPDYKYNPKKKQKILQKKERYSLPGNLMTSDGNPLSSITGFSQRTDLYTHLNSWPNGPYFLMQQHFDYMQHPELNSSEAQPPYRYGINTLCYNNMMPSAQAYVNSFPYNITPTYSHKNSTAMAMGTMVSGIKTESSSPLHALAPHIQSDRSGEMISMYMPSSGGQSDQSPLQNRMYSFHQHYPTLENEVNGNVALLHL